VPRKKKEDVHEEPRIFPADKCSKIGCAQPVCGVNALGLQSTVGEVAVFLCQPHLHLAHCASMDRQKMERPEAKVVFCLYDYEFDLLRYLLRSENPISVNLHEGIPDARHHSYFVWDWEFRYGESLKDQIGFWVLAEHFAKILEERQKGDGRWDIVPGKEESNGESGESA